jgi:hypothetical protein
MVKKRILERIAKLINGWLKNYHRIVKTSGIFICSNFCQELKKSQQKDRLTDDLFRKRVNLLDS